MEILGIGTSELVFIVIIALIILGPKDMQKAGKTIGRWLRNLVTSDSWKVVQQTSRELRTLPNRLMREANEELDQAGKELNNVSDSVRNWPNPPGRTPPLKSIPADSPNRIAPPGAEVKTNEGDTQQDA